MAFGLTLGAAGMISVPAAQASPQSQSGKALDPAQAAMRRSEIFVARRGVGASAKSVPAGALRRAREQHAAMVRRLSSSLPGGSGTSWQPVGPLQVQTASWKLVTGRVTSIAADPSDSSGNTVYVGTTGGGVWKSTNAAGAAGAVSFAPLTDTISAFSSAAVTSLSMGAVSVQPSGGVILAGTGDPNDATDSWYGAGILRSTDGGNNWSLITETTATAASLGYVFPFAGNAIAGFAWSTATPNLVVAAVSESEYGALLGMPSGSSLLGLYYSQDAGATWQMATIEDGTAVIQSPQMNNLLGNAATAVVWNPIRQRFYAAVRRHGYYESLDGVTWTRLINQPASSLTTALCPPYPGTVGSMACPIERGTLAVQPVTGDLFALTVDGNNIDQGFWQDVCNQNASGACANGSVQFGRQILDAQLHVTATDSRIAEGLYTLALAAVPSQQDTLLFAGTTDLWRCSLANGCGWHNTTNTQTCAAAQVAPSQHAIEGTFGAEGLLYFGNDGGLWRTADAVNQQSPSCSADDASHFQNLNGGLGSLAEVESFSQDPGNDSTWLAALGGLGTAAPSASPGVWNQVLDGEGDGVAIDPVNPENWYATSIFGVGINVCTEGTACDMAGFGNIVIGEPQVADDVQLIPAAWILDPQNTANLILGTCRVWRGPASGGAAWNGQNLLSGMLDGDQGAYCNGDAEIRSLAAAPITSPGSSLSGAEQIYAGMAGVLDGGYLKPGHVFTASVQSGAQASNTTWTDLYYSQVLNDGSSGLQFNPNGFDISSIYADPHDASGQTVYVTIQGYSSAVSSQPLVYRSTDGGAHWLDITSNLPVTPANSVLVDPNNASMVYVATDTGVYFTENVANCSVSNTVCWNVLGSGLPNAPVTSLESYNQGATQLLRVATYGRGLWQTELVSAGVITTTATASPATLTFSGQPVETSSGAQTVTVTNTGASPLAVSAVGFTTGDFSETDNCIGQPVAPGASCQIHVVFVPFQPGPVQDVMTISANVSGGQLTVTLTGTGLAAAGIVLTPPSLAFGALPIGTTTAAQFVTVANTSSQTIGLSAESVSGDYTLASNTCTSALQGGSSCTVGITFTPATTGARNGTLTVSDAAGKQTAPLSGTGESPATDSLSTGSLVFATQQVGTSSAAQQVNITNSGDEALTEIAVSVTGDFSAVNHCGTQLQGHGTCSISVVYAPTTTGAESGTLTITDLLRTQTVLLSGTGSAPPGISATPTSLSFGGVGLGTTGGPQMVTVTNNGAVTITGLSAAITAGFAIAGNQCPGTLSAGSACQLQVTFSPAAAGAESGTLSLTATNLPKAMTVALSGAGVDFSMGVTGSSSVVVTSGQTATFTLQLAGVSGSTGTVTLACAGAPQNAACSLNPASVAVSGANTSSATVTVATGVATTSSEGKGIAWGRAVPLLVLALPVACGGFRRRKSPYKHLWLVVALLTGMLVPIGCGVEASAGSGGGGSGGSGGGGSGGGGVTTPSGTYTITVSGSMAGISHSATVKLTVE